MHIFIYAQGLNIAVSSNLSFVIGEILKEFKKQNKNIKINTTISSSGKLSTQIIHYAPFDVFLSADMKFPNILFDKGFGASKPQIYARGKLALFSYTKKDFSSKLNILLNKNIKKIAIANPKLAPYGIASVDMLQKLKIYNKLKSKYIFSPSISTTLFYTQQVCDIGIISQSLLYTKALSKMKENENYYKISPSLHSNINQGIVLLKRAKDNKNAIVFYDFIFSKKALKILSKYGYMSVDG